MKTKLNESTKYADVKSAAWGMALHKNNPANPNETEPVLISNIGADIVFVTDYGYFRSGLKCKHLDMNGTYLEDVKNWLKGSFEFRRLVTSFEIF